MTELADVRDSKSRAARRKGSSPFAPTNKNFTSYIPIGREPEFKLQGLLVRIQLGGPIKINKCVGFESNAFVNF